MSHQAAIEGGLTEEGPTQAAADDGLPHKVPARRGFSVVYRGRALLSLHDPLGQAERVVEALLPAQERTLYLCPSPLYAYALGSFREALPPSSALLCVEADKTLYEWTLANAPPDAPPLLHTQDPPSLCRFVRETWGPRTFRRALLVRLTGGYDLEAVLYEAFVDALRRDIQIQWGNALTLTRLGRRYIRNAIRNLPLLAFPTTASLTAGAAPLLVAGAGPSLDAFLDGAAGAIGPGVCVVAVDTSLRPLLERGITPALVVALEAQHWNLADFAGAVGRPIPLAMDFSALPATAGCLAGQPLLFFTPWTKLRLFTRLAAAGLLPPAFPPLGSVGLSAVALALRLTTGPVITAGLDFSFTADAYHCRGSPGHRAFLQRRSRLTGPYPSAALFRAGSVRALSKSGLPVRTDPSLQHYRALFRAEFGANERIFDIEGGGLSLGVQTLSVRGALARLRASPAAFKAAGDADCAARGARLRSFIAGERALLERLRAALAGTGGAHLDSLLDDADYLWAHFPDCAGAGGRRPPASDAGFLKRVRAEADSFLKLW
ncbi:MAG: DUF115 domain-containing protein, partial [Spirochaetaceae bacterium]|nr:DUF115 domain-containing protein [Spirochaetaceae bacterium]